MDRSRSKLYYYNRDYEYETLHSLSKPRHSRGGGGSHHYAPSYHRRSSSSSGGGGGGVEGRKMHDPSLIVTSYLILCHDMKAGGVMGKSGSIIKAIRQHTGAFINVHELTPGDEERIIEISVTRRRDLEGKMPSFSPAQEALMMIHDRIMESEMASYGDNGALGEDEHGEYGGRRGGGSGNGGRVVTRLVVSRMDVGCLIGKGGKIIEQMRTETRAHIRILPRDHNLPRCVAMSEEIVQVTGDANAVKNAIAIISSRLRESQHRDRGLFSNQLHPPDDFYPVNDDIHAHKRPRRLSLEGPSFGSRHSGDPRNNHHFSHSSGFTSDSGPTTVVNNAQTSYGDSIMFRILCPVGKLDSIIGESGGIVDLLQNEVGVNVEVSDLLNGCDEHVIVISSHEGPDDELFPAQEALLRIQNRIVDLVPEKENIIMTRSLLQSGEIDSLFELDKIGSADIKILPREELPTGLSGADEILQIVGEIKAAREALVEVTLRVRSYIYREFLEKDGVGPVEPEEVSRIYAAPSAAIQPGNGSLYSTSQSSSAAGAPQKAKQREMVHRCHGIERYWKGQFS